MPLKIPSFSQGKVKVKVNRFKIISNSALTTLVACFPVCIALIRRPEKQRFVYGLSSVSLSFFLFSYHVHEKSILLPALPILLLYGKEPTLVHWFVNVSVFSMYPLIKKDNLQLAYVAMLIFWHAVHSVPQQWSWLHSIRNPYARFIIKSSMFGMIAIHLADALITPPAKLPDIFTMMNVVLSAGVFLIINAYLIWKTLSLSSKQKSE